MEWIFLRGLGRSSGHWDDFPQKLTAACGGQFKTIDLPGTGRFHKLPAARTVSGNSDFVMEQLGEIDSPRFLVAISFGGMVAVDLLLRYPQKFEGAILINSSAAGLSGPFERAKPPALLKLFQIACTLDAKKREEAVWRLTCNQPIQSELLEARVKIAKDFPITRMTLIRQLWAASTFKPPRQLPQKKILILSSEGDTLVSSQCSKRMATAWRVPLELHPSAGHDLPLEEPQWVVQKIKDFTQH